MYLRQAWQWCCAWTLKQAWHSLLLVSFPDIEAKYRCNPAGSTQSDDHYVWRSERSMAILSSMNTEAEFQWIGLLPLGPKECVVELSINRAFRGDLPEVRAHDGLPEVGPFREVKIAGETVTLYRYIIRHKGLRALFANRKMLGIYCAYLELDGKRFLFRLKADQLTTQDGQEWLKETVFALENAYLDEDYAALQESPFLEPVRTLIEDSDPLEATRELYLAEAATERKGEVLFLHQSDRGQKEPYKIRFPFAPGTNPSLALRIEGVERQIRRSGLTVQTGKGNRGLRVALEVPASPKPKRLLAKTNREGWAEFLDIPLTSPRQIQFRVGPAKSPPRLKGVFVLRWGRPLENELDSPVPYFGGASANSSRVKDWKKILLQDIRASWDPDRGVLRCTVPGQVLEDQFEWFLTLRQIGTSLDWLEEFLEATRTRLLSKNSQASPLVQFALGGKKVTLARQAAQGILESIESQPMRVWSGEAAREIRRLFWVAQERPDSKLLKIASEACECLAQRIESEPEPTWSYRAHGRPIKTFQANSDVAQPHAEAILALLAAVQADPNNEYLQEIAESQAEHLIEMHPLDGQPPGWVVGTWKDRARLETPMWIGQALDTLSPLTDSSKVQRRAKRVRSLVWNRFLSYRESVEIAERVRLASWLQAIPADDD